MTDAGKRARDYLQRLMDEEQDIRLLQGRAAAFRDMAVSVTPHLSGVPGTCSSDMQRNAGRIDEAIDLEAEAESKRQAWLRHRREAKDYIGQIASSSERNVLQSRYLDGLSWSMVALALGYSEPSMFRMHRRALEHLGRLLPC